MEALATLGIEVPPWRYVCKVWPQKRTEVQNALDIELARALGISDRVEFCTHQVSRDLMPYLLAACDVYAAPSRLEGFGMSQVEAGACGKPVLGIRAMGMLDTLIHGETAFLADVAQEIQIRETVLGPESGFEPGHRIVFDKPRVSDYRASVPDIARHLKVLLNDAELRQRMGAAGRQRAVEHFDYRIVARRLVAILQERRL
jgi:glycosyltransferase involved in cell wall biosynthesis